MGKSSEHRADGAGDSDATSDVFSFGEGRADGDAKRRDVLGGKGAGLAEMTNAGIPVPPGFTISTAVCRHWYSSAQRLPEGYEAREATALALLERRMGRRLGDATDPLLVSVRSGARYSMPGMMDTILNLGLTDRSVTGLAGRADNPRFAWDCYRRFIQMFASVVLGVEKHAFEALIRAHKQRRRIALDSELGALDWSRLVTAFKALVKRRTGREFPQDPYVQLALARDAVFRSWNNDRAIYYRRQNQISDEIGTAVTVQAMVFGNLGESSGTGVGFTRNPATGERVFYGEYLTNAQGEDVVAGIRTPRPIAELQEQMPEVFTQLRDITARLETHYRDVQDFEFTIEDGRLFLLQTRIGKRTAQAAVRIAVEMVAEGTISRAEALMRVEPTSLDQLLHPRLDEKARFRVLATGLAASPGAAVGRAVFDADLAVERSRREKVILVRRETTPDDIHGMDAAAGVLTSTGGLTSHAAVVARGMGKPCVCGATSVVVDDRTRSLVAGGVTIREGEWLTIDGATGRVIAGQVRTLDAQLSREFETLMTWADAARRLKVRSNADIPRDARKARAFGAEGIGLCRTEHMFFAEDRLPHVVAMILAAPEAKQCREQLAAQRAALAGADPTSAKLLRKQLAVLERRARPALTRYRTALARLLPHQRADFRGLFTAMDGYPVTIRTLDPPLHEFLPKREELMTEVAVLRHDWERAGRRAKQAAKPAKLRRLETLLRRVEELHEFNPMLGHRGCRLGITYPEITEMQVRAIFEGACDAARKGVVVRPEIMIPLVGHANELSDQAAIVRRVAAEVMAKKQMRIEYQLGTMIEVPRAAVTADRIAVEAEFFSFGTNDLTQLTFGFSRDDAGKYLPEYGTRRILPADPFVTLDVEGVGALIQWAVERGRATRPELKVGICGEHGGDPATVEFCHRAGLDYVSCSPFRVPIARLAAAQAAVRGQATGSDGR
ncbi:MAG: pyruvate, phosphate dikinase [Candidatus Eisenbacteria bacterium]|uniref:Pyruvate, phosphate dikinase n=1 Tax=Eiseniibacteriota bacterium TaxID=2212470 RepID=A0A849SNW8_UNCEI|nr:pyruvate, phosphate dikinase [Candidatus Eisenbacteria bacterium]